MRNPVMNTSRRNRPSRNLLIFVALLALNGLAWLQIDTLDLPLVEPHLAPEISEVREKIWSGKASGESFSLVVTDEMAAQAVAWYLERHPNVPFSHPQVHIDPGGLTGSGLAHLLGLRTQVHGRVAFSLEDGTMSLNILELGVAGATAPAFVLQAVEAELLRQVDLANALPVKLTRLELRQGDLIVEGIYK